MVILMVILTVTDAGPNPSECTLELVLVRTFSHVNKTLTGGKRESVN